MNIALLGYGKMGRIIEKIAMDRNHTVVLRVGSQNLDEITVENLRKADVAIEFSTPASVMNNIEHCFNAGIPVVIGTTGWYSNLPALKELCLHRNNTLLYGSNFSVGVNVFFYVNQLLAKVMNNYPYYDVQVEEIHHTQKLDAPSGTAITIAEGIINNLNSKQSWKNILNKDDGEEPLEEPLTGDELLIESFRIDSVPGTHTVIYDSEVDMIEFRHTAHNRNGFALGAVLAAEWLQGKKGFYEVKDMFDFKLS
jgi:4-hydroxy-tetrahydrodipicolinate reductase